MRGWRWRLTGAQEAYESYQKQLSLRRRIVWDGEEAELVLLVHPSARHVAFMIVVAGVSLRVGAIDGWRRRGLLVEARHGARRVQCGRRRAM